MARPPFELLPAGSGSGELRRAAARLSIRSASGRRSSRTRRSAPKTGPVRVRSDLCRERSSRPAPCLRGAREARQRLHGRRRDADSRPRRGLRGPDTGRPRDGRRLRARCRRPLRPMRRWPPPSRPTRPRRQPPGRDEGPRMIRSLRDVPGYVDNAFVVATPRFQPENIVLGHYTFLPWVRSGIAAFAQDGRPRISGHGPGRDGRSAGRRRVGRGRPRSWTVRPGRRHRAERRADRAAPARPERRRRRGQLPGPRRIRPPRPAVAVLTVRGERRAADAVARARRHRRLDRPRPSARARWPAARP